MTPTKERMIIERSPDNEPMHCGVIMQNAGGNPSGTKMCQRYKCNVCRRTWTDVNKPFIPKDER